jgi:hypothetical protein
MRFGNDYPKPTQTKRKNRKNTKNCQKESSERTMVLRSFQRDIFHVPSLKTSPYLFSSPSSPNTKIHHRLTATNQHKAQRTNAPPHTPPKMHTLFHPLHNTTHWHSPRNLALLPNSPISLTKTSPWAIVPNYSLDDNNDCDVRPHIPAPPNNPGSRTLAKTSTFVTVPYYSLDGDNDCDCHVRSGDA